MSTFPVWFVWGESFADVSAGMAEWGTHGNLRADHRYPGIYRAPL